MWSVCGDMRREQSNTALSCPGSPLHAQFVQRILKSCNSFLANFQNNLRTLSIHFKSNIGKSSSVDCALFSDDEITKHYLDVPFNFYYENKKHIIQENQLNFSITWDLRTARKYSSKDDCCRLVVTYITDTERTKVSNNRRFN